MKMKISDIIRRGTDENMAQIIGAVIAMQTEGLTVEEAIGSDYPKTLEVLQSEMEVNYELTNADRIHSMSIEELTEFIINNCDNPISDKNEDMCDYCEKYDDWKAECDKESCKKAIANWLQSEVEG